MTPDRSHLELHPGPEYSCTVAHFDGRGRPIPCPDARRADPPPDRSRPGITVPLTLLAVVAAVVVAVAWFALNGGNR